MRVLLHRQPVSLHATERACGSIRLERRYTAPVQARRLGAMRRCSGFTLVELVTSITVGVIISGIAGTLIWNASRQRAEISARSELADMGSAALEIMLRYIREIPQIDECSANPIPCLNGKADIDVATGTELRFAQLGFRFDEETTTLEMVNNYFIKPETWYPIAADVTSLSFLYYDRCGQMTTSENDIRRIRMEMTLSRGVQTTVLATSIYLRSFMDEWETDASCD